MIDVRRALLYGVYGTALIGLGTGIYELANPGAAVQASGTCTCYKNADCGSGGSCTPGNCTVVVGCSTICDGTCSNNC
jgi:hypothetical protein